MDGISKVAKAKLRRICLNLNLDDNEKEFLVQMYLKGNKFHRDFILDEMDKRSESHSWSDRWKMKRLICNS